MIYVFGDSHVNFFTCSHPAATNSKYGSFISHCIGPGTAHHFFENRYQKMLDVLQLYELSDNDHILLCAGEIDCRIHIPKIYLQTKTPLNTLIEKSVDRLILCYLYLMDGEINCVGWGPQPSLVLYNRGDETDKFAYGHYTLRNDITREWNNVLEHKCNIHGIPFVSLFDELINDDNTAKTELYTDDCHLNSKALWNIVNQKFKDKGLV